MPLYAFSDIYHSVSKMSCFILKPCNLFIHWLFFIKTLFSVTGYYLLLFCPAVNLPLRSAREMLSQTKLRLIGLELHKNSVVTELAIAHNVQRHNGVYSRWIFSAIPYTHISHQKYPSSLQDPWVHFTYCMALFIIVPSNHLSHQTV